MQNADILNNQAVQLNNQGKGKEAIALLKAILSLEPNHPQAVFNLATIYKGLREYNQAIKYYYRAIKINPNLTAAYTNLGISLAKIEQFTKAIEIFKKALSLSPNSPKHYYLLGNCYFSDDQITKAVESYQKAIDINPNYKQAYPSLFMAKRTACDWKGLEKIEGYLDQSAYEDPWESLIRSEDPELNLKFARLKSKAVAEGLPANLFSFTPKVKEASDKIRIGYLSSDFRDHATTHLTLGLFKGHDRNKFEVYIYSYGPDDGSPIRQKIERDADKFIDIAKLGPIEAAEKIYEDKVDILVDINGHTKGSRLEIAALKPAPIEVTYLGFPGTTGADFIDYILTDKTITPPGTSKYYSEEIAYLPHCYQVNNDKRQIADIKFTRKDFGLPQKAFVFSCFNYTHKVDPQTFLSWMNILKAVPESVLWLLKGNDIAEINLKNEAKKLGVSPDRIIFASAAYNREHLARIKLSDLALDTFIYGGHTTTSDILWASVPVITVLGKHFASRVCASILKTAGFPELIAETKEEYEKKAIFLAESPNELKKIRKRITHKHLRKNLYNTKEYIKDLELIYSAMWNIYQNGKKPSQIEL